MCLCFCCSDCILVIIAIFFPPLPVWIRRGICSADSFINIALCILGYLPGLFHAWYIISKYPEDEEIYEYDYERQSYNRPGIYVSVPQYGTLQPAPHPPQQQSRPVVTVSSPPPQVQSPSFQAPPLQADSKQQHSQPAFANGQSSSSQGPSADNETSMPPTYDEVIRETTEDIQSR